MVSIQVDIIYTNNNKAEDLIIMFLCLIALISGSTSRVRKNILEYDGLIHAEGYSNITSNRWNRGVQLEYYHQPQLDMSLSSRIELEVV